MARLKAWTTFAVLLLTAALPLGALRLGATQCAGASASLAPAQATSAPSPSATPGGCVATFTKTVWPERIPLGDGVSVTLHARPVCPMRYFPMHVVLVMDGSATMAGSAARSMKEGARRFVQDLSLGPDRPIEVGVVDYNASARTLCGLLSDEADVLRCIDKVGAVGEPHLDAGLTEGLRALSQGRRGVDRSLLLEVMVVLSDGRDPDGCDPALQQAATVKGQGVVLIAVCVTRACVEDCLRRVASSPRYYFRIESFVTGFGPMLVEYWRWVATIDAGALTFDDTLGPDMEYVVGSARPVPSLVVTPTRRLRWHWWAMPDGGLPTEGLTATYRVTPTRPGLLPVNLEATGVLTTGRGAYVFRWEFPVPEVEVLGDAPPTARPSSTATATGSATEASVTPTVTWAPTTVTAGTPATRMPSATPSATAWRDRIALPLLYDGRP